MYTVIQILIFKYLVCMHRKKGHEKLSTKVLTVVLHFKGMITGNYFFFNSIHFTFLQRVYVTLL